MTASPKRPPILRDPKYLRAVREMPCVLTHTTPCDPAHIRHGFLGIAEKPGDDLVLPLAHHLHREQHTVGEKQFWWNSITQELLMTALKALARERYREWKEANSDN